MPAFNAGTVVEPLDYSLEPFVKGCKGTIKEPTDKQIAEFLSHMQDLITEARAQGLAELKISSGDAQDQERVIDALNALTPEQTLTQLRHMSELYAAVCSNHPTAGQIGQLPLRVRVAFFAWIQREVISPEAGPGAGTAQVIKLPAAAAG